MDWIYRYSELLKAQGVGYLRFGDLLLREYGQIIIPMGPVIQVKPSVEVDVNKIFSELKGKLVWWSYAQKASNNSDWYAIVKNRYLKVEEYPSSKMRNKIRNSLKNCEIRQISAEWLSKNGYEVYKNSVSEFLSSKEQFSSENYRLQISITTEFEDIIHYWGVFINEKLIGYAVVYIYGQMEANVSEIRISKNFKKVRPSYALLHRLSEEYLEKQRFEYINNGYRNLLHDTEIQQLLLNDFGYKKLDLTLDMAIKIPINYIIWGFYPIRKIFNTIKQLKAIYTLIEIINKQKRLPK